MKFSDAILLGSTKTKETRRYFLSEDGTCGCAIGAAAAAVGVSTQEVEDRFGDGELPEAGRFNTEAWLDWVGSTWRWTRQLQYCPVCPAPGWWARRRKHGRRSVASIVNHLHYKHQWSRPEIAAWVATVEPVEPLVEKPFPHVMDVRDRASVP
jgi:hypothetical protein